MAIVRFPGKTQEAADDSQPDKRFTLTDLAESFGRGDIVSVSFAVVEKDGSSWGYVIGPILDALIGAHGRVGHQMMAMSTVGDEAED